MTQPTALFLADVIDADADSASHHDAAAAELRRLHAENEALLEACNNTFSCRCSKHFALQQPEQRPKRVLTAVWRDRAQRAEAQRDALLMALQRMAARGVRGGGGAGMTDRELLELAAKAAGYDCRWEADGDFMNLEDNLPWNPLTDDGDALRLAVKLRTRVSVGQVDWVGNEYVGEFSTLEEVESDPIAATRRAIVRAAAEIGRSMA